MRPPQVLRKYEDLEPKHLLDLLRSSFINPELQPKNCSRSTGPIHLISPISTNKRAGIDFRQGKSETFLQVKFTSRCLIEMPKLSLDNFTASLLANCVVYEQCHKRSPTYFTAYVTLLDCLFGTPDDVGYLCQKRIIENYFGKEAEVADFIHRLGKDVSFDIDECYLEELFTQVTDYFWSWRSHWAAFKNAYFKSAWSFISAVAAFVLLLLSILQTLYTVIPYYMPRN